MDNNNGIEKQNMQVYDTNNFKVNNSNKNKTWVKGLIVFGVILVLLVVIAIIAGSSENSDSNYKFSGEYIGELHIEGEITDSKSSDILSSSSYDHQFLMDRVDGMIEDSNNKGIILFINTPGGSVYASDELYLKLEEYKKETGRPVYAYFGSVAASGGYYIGSAANKIVANRNCWTGSIGVTIGSVYDLSGLLKKLGVKTVTIDSGANKSMGSSVKPLTSEQKAIYQGLVDEAYEQFVQVVADARKMTTAQVKKLADGRVYSAKQAKTAGLVDDIGSFDDAVAQMKQDCNLENATVEDIQPETESSLASLFMNLFGKEETSADSETVKSQLDDVKSLMELDNKFTISYKANIDK